ncbi:hypothetical protein [Micromonospora sp. NPDC005806]|uniref:hypothetical protein n=1 Tax=Micromonospora sp. NPDC005806 TaxID=3364234 RepID=UPI00368706B5
MAEVGRTGGRRVGPGRPGRAAALGRPAGRGRPGRARSPPAGPAARGYRAAGPAGRRRRLPGLAESAQLAGWLAADAGEVTGGLDAYRLALRAAVAAGDPAGHVLGSASHLLAGVGDPLGALALARSGYAGSRDAASPGLRALLLHRVAFAAALAGRSRAARQALDAADGTGGPEPDREPPWLYWLDEAELAAMTGRTLVALGRPGPAVSLLAPVARAGPPPPRRRTPTCWSRPARTCRCGRGAGPGRPGRGGRGRCPARHADRATRRDRRGPASVLA